MPAPRNEERANLLMSLYAEGLSLAKAAAQIGVTRQSAYKMLKRRNAELRSPNLRAFVMFKGEKYTLRNNGYYGKTTDERCLLHRAIWEDAHGPIPPGYDIHHIDEDKSNNVLSNFDIHTKSEHGRRHGFGGNQYTGSLGRRPVRW